MPKIIAVVKKPEEVMKHLGGEYGYYGKGPHGGMLCSKLLPGGTVDNNPTEVVELVIERDHK